MIEEAQMMIVDLMCRCVDAVCVEGLATKIGNFINFKWDIGGSGLSNEILST